MTYFLTLLANSRDKLRQHFVDASTTLSQNDQASPQPALGHDAVRASRVATVANFEPSGLYFRRQVPFRNYILDFVDHSARLVVELDGAQHGEDQGRLRDMARDELIRNEGYCVLRLWNHEVIDNVEAVVDLIYRVARERLGGKKA